MILLGKNQEWPVKWVQRSNSPFRHPEPVPFSHVVADGLAKWKTRTLARPTHLLLGWNARQHFFMDVARHCTRQVENPSEDSEYMGLKIRWIECLGVEILGDAQ